jgi:hypothetical protein
MFRNIAAKQPIQLLVSRNGVSLSIRSKGIINTPKAVFQLVVTGFGGYGLN